MMKPALPLVVLAAIAVSGVVRAETLDDYLQHGYTIVRSTTLPGQFNGCMPRLALTFADQTTFLCSRTVIRSGFDLHAVVLQSVTTPTTTVMMIGAHSYDGSITRLGTTEMLLPISASADLLADDDAPARQQPETRISARAGILSITAMQNQETTRLNDAQTLLPRAAQIKKQPDE